MIDIQVPLRATNRQDLLYQSAHSASKLLTSYCTHRLKELRLVTSTFEYEMQLRHSNDLMNKGLTRLARILERNLIKNNPSLIHALKQGNCPTLLSSYRGGIAVTFCTYTENDNEAIRRYVRYMNYLCVKHKMPLHVTAEAWPAQAEIPAGIRVYADISVKHKNLMHASSLGDLVRDPTGCEAAIQQERQRLIDAGKDPDRVYSVAYPELYVKFHVWKNMVGNGVFIPRTDTAVVEKIFFNLPSIIQSLNSLSRKFAYAPTAFAIDPVECT